MIEREFKLLNNIYLIRLASSMYQYLADKHLLQDYQQYLKDRIK